MKKREKYYVLLSAILLFILSFIIFYRLTINIQGDFEAHYKFAQQLSLLKNMSISDFIANVSNSHIISYPVWHIGFLVIENILLFLHMDGVFDLPTIFAISSATITSIFYILNYLVIYLVLKKFIHKKHPYFYILVSVTLVLVGPYYFKQINPSYYLGQGAANVWHNPTIVTVASLSVLCFFLYIYMIDNIDRLRSSSYLIFKKYKISKEHAGLLIFSILLTLSAFFKPSFFQMFVPGLFMYCCFDLVLHKFKNFMFYVKTGIAVVPVVLIALLQMQLSFSTNGDGIGFEFLHVWNLFSPQPILSLLISIVFPLFVFILFIKNTYKDSKLPLLTVCVFGSGLLQFMFLYKLIGAAAGDFAWGFYLSVMLLFISSWIMLENKKNNPICKIICYVIYIPHLLFGVVYIYRLITELDIFGPLF